MTTKSGSRMRTLACAGAAILLALVSASALAKKDDDAKTRYPNAARSAPKSDLTNAGDQKALQAAIDAVNGGDDAKAQESAQKVVDSSKSKYAKGIALQVLANIKFNAQDYKSAIDNYNKLIELNSVANDAYFDSMYNIAAAYIADGQYQPALDELKTWREQVKRETAGVVRAGRQCLLPPAEISGGDRRDQESAVAGDRAEGFLEQHPDGQLRRKRPGRPSLGRDRGPA